MGESAGRRPATTLLGSAAVHAAVIPQRLGYHWALQGEFFWLLVMAQSVAGVLVVRMQRSGLLLELASLGLALSVLRGRTVRSATSTHVRAIGIASVVAVTVIGAAGTTLPGLGAFPPATRAHGAGDHTSPGS